MLVLLFFIFLAALAVLAVSLLAWLVSALRKHPTQKKKRTALVSLIVCVVAFAAALACVDTPGENAEPASTSSPESSVQEEPQDAESTQVEKPEEEEPSETPVPEEAPASSESEALTMTDIGPIIESTIAQGFENYDVVYDDTGIIISVWQENIAAGATLAKAGQADMLDAWESLKANTTDLCASICELVDTFGIDDASVMVNVLNDTNRENVLLSIIDGVVVYDSVAAE